MRYVRSRQPKGGSHNQSLEISFHRAAEKGEISPWLHYPDNSRVRGPKHSAASLPPILLLPAFVFFFRSSLSSLSYHSFFLFNPHLTKHARF